MSELNFKGKEFVFNHHLAVPHRPLVPDAAKSIGTPRLDGNLVIHGDNLHALKALLPMYAGKVDCVFIDPPYNTGNEGWCYNDNVNSPMMQEWLRSNPIGIEDGLRHDKWCAMMWPRLRLLHELLGEAGSIWITLDDNEVHRARSMLDSIFGEQNFIANVAWIKRYTRSNNAKMFYSLKDNLLVYRKSSLLNVIKEPRSEAADAGYSNPDGDPRGAWMTSSYVNPATREQRQNLCYGIKNPHTGLDVYHPTHAWKYGFDEHQRHVAEGLLWWGVDGNATYPRLKLFLDEANSMVPVDVWNYTEVGSSDDGGDEVKRIFGSSVFDNPKPLPLIEKILSLVPKKNALVLDSFAGSGTTGHAVLSANKKDGGHRKFILVECEAYADSLTAERIRRVSQGYAYQGNHRVELMQRSLTFTDLRNADRLLHDIAAIENLEGSQYDRLDKKVKDGVLLVEGVKQITERMEGLGGEFTYCTLGAAVDMDRMLTGEHLPSFDQLGALLYHMATNEAMQPAALALDQAAGIGYLGESAQYHVWLIYKPELQFLQSREAALTMAKAQDFVAAKPGKKQLVFAPAKFVSQRLLVAAGLAVEFAPLPWALYRAERG
ncbi:site-specific DNA-methyltransferase [Serpentinimonas maccroryi]|uniref:site-specific DNA-methyltransferase n=1 Tax=Serpentinimonas maccroryi TaxID=1458426 RepID=UPI0005EEC28A|nr:site-specific DNA-methyltransferase [Serpentinimonas maccroryi]